jgi:hypothetical protein
MNNPRTPGEWLLSRRRNAGPKLDAIRHRALFPESRTWVGFLADLFYPHRIAWRTLLIVWLGLVVFHLTLGRPAHQSPSPAAAPENLNAWLIKLRSNDTIAQIDRLP